MRHNISMRTFTVGAGVGEEKEKKRKGTDPGSSYENLWKRPLEGCLHPFSQALPFGNGNIPSTPSWEPRLVWTESPLTFITLKPRFKRFPLTWS